MVVVAVAPDDGAIVVTASTDHGVIVVVVRPDHGGIVALAPANDRPVFAPTGGIGGPALTHRTVNRRLASR